MRKNWNFSIAQSENLWQTLEKLTQPLGRSALVLSGGVPLHVSGESCDWATLPHAAAICERYLNLKEGDFALTNDPTAGGTVLSDFTLVTAFSLEAGDLSNSLSASVSAAAAKSAPDVVLAKRIGLARRTPGMKGLNNEGVRVPPMPFGNGGKISSETLAAIAGHPLAPFALAQGLEAAAEELRSTVARIKAVAREPGSELKSSAFKRYFADSELAVESLLARLPLGAASVSTRLPSGELIKFQLRVSERSLVFDFAGTETSTVYALSPTVTLSACLAATCAAIGLTLPINAGTLARFQVSTPERTLLSAEAPAQMAAGTNRGLTFGFSAVCDLVSDAFVKLRPTLETAAAPGSEGTYEFEAKGATRVFCGSIAPGGGATADNKGEDASARWVARTQPGIDVAASESSFPIQVLAHGTRAGSGGKGRHRGGDGTLFAFRALAPGTLRWMFGSMVDRQDSFKSGRVGQTAKVEIRRAKDGEAESFETPEGTLDVAAGDSVYLLGSGGGGYGEPVDASATESAT